MGKQIGEQLMPNGSDVPPPIPPSVSYFLAIDGKQQGPYNSQQIQEAITQDSNVLNLLAWKKGMVNWQPLSSFVEFATQDDSECPPPIPE